MELVKQITRWRDAGESKESIEFLSANWKLLDGMRLYKPNSFDFVVQSCCFYNNFTLGTIACNVLANKMHTLIDQIQKDEVPISASESTMNNSYDIILLHEDYTIGKMLEHVLYSKYFVELKTMTFCGFKKMHPHDNESILRVAYKEAVEISGVKIDLESCAKDIIHVFENIKGVFAASTNKQAK
jgi:DNA-directed RNA polymerase subunit L